MAAFVSPRSSDSSAAAFAKCLNEAGYVADQNVTVEYHWFDGQYDPSAVSSKYFETISGASDEETRGVS